MTPNILEYFKGDTVVVNGAVKDRLGRVILPLDTVIFGSKSDQGPELLINATVVKIDEDQILVEPPENFAELGFTKEWVAAVDTIRLPLNNASLMIELSHYFTNINRNIIFFSGGSLTKNGVVLNA